MKNLSLDQTEATCQWFDEKALREQREDAGEDVRVPASPAPLLLRYPVWEKSFFEYGWGVT